MAEDPNNVKWLESIGLLVGGGGIAGVGVQIVKAFLNRRNKQEESRDRVASRHEDRIRKDYDALYTRYEAALKELEDERRQNQQQFRALVAMETENKLLRARYHRMRGYVMFVYEQVRKKLNLPPDQDLGIPSWVDEDVPGPTAPSPTHLSFSLPYEPPKPEDMP